MYSTLCSPLTLTTSNKRASQPSESNIDKAGHKLFLGRKGCGALRGSAAGAVTAVAETSASVVIAHTTGTRLALDVRVETCTMVMIGS